VEKIKQALERARSEQQAQEHASQRGEPSPRTVHASAESAPINYSQTQVVTVDDAILKRNLLVAGLENCEAATAYKLLRTQVEQRLATRGWNALAITSPGAGQGKTLTAINLSIALARELHRTVLLVDLDLRNPNVHLRFEHAVTKGLVDYLLTDTPLNEILINPGIDRLVLLPAGRTAHNSSELLSSPKMQRLVDELKSRYPLRIIVFDLPPLLSADDALAFSPYVDTTLLVIEDGKTTKDELLRAVEMLQGVHLLGTVLNKAAETQQTYYV
jgi:protein-tyrosine kinase